LVPGFEFNSLRRWLSPTQFEELFPRPKKLASDPRFAANAARLVNRDALTEALSTRFADEDGHELTRRMLAIGLPAGPVLYVDEAMAADPYRAPQDADGTRRLG
jgi:crotonobetainyl-CoA:carnitine CoA-transferase CaiB-like acyl-CoA transferase